MSWVVRSLGRLINQRRTSYSRTRGRHPAAIPAPVTALPTALTPAARDPHSELRRSGGDCNPLRFQPRSDHGILCCILKLENSHAGISEGGRGSKVPTPNGETCPLCRIGVTAVNGRREGSRRPS